MREQSRLSEEAREREHANRMKAMSHPIRRRCYAILNERVASPQELGAELGETADVTSYHCKRLVALECAELVREEKAAGSGAISHFYRAVSRDMVLGDLWNDMGPDSGEDFLASIMGRMVRDFTRSTEAGMIGSDESFHLARTLHHFDALAVDEALAIQEEARVKLAKVQARSDERARSNGSATSVVTTWQACFEVPPAGAR